MCRDIFVYVCLLRVHTVQHIFFRKNRSTITNTQSFHSSNSFSFLSSSIAYTRHIQEIYFCSFSNLDFDLALVLCCWLLLLLLLPNFSSSFSPCLVLLLYTARRKTFNLTRLDDSRPSSFSFSIVKESFLHLYSFLLCNVHMKREKETQNCLFNSPLDRRRRR